MADAIDFQPYLKAILSDPANQDWGDRYTPTQVELLLKVRAIVQANPGDPTAQRQSEAQQRDRFEVLEGLRKAVREHHQVLLIGKPGSGKSTALRRLLWEEAQKSLELSESGQGNFTIPVLIELRSYSSGSVPEWIEEELQIDDLDQKTIKSLLRERRLLLLLDGLNEMPSDKGWRTLETFLQNRNSQSIPTVVTTRELGVSANLGIEKKLEMMPLTEPQMREFIQKRLPGQADNLLRQLKDRLRELAETPLLLKILCDVVAESNDGQLPQNRGELFRQEFARRYEKFKPLRGRVSDDSRRFAPELLQHLAFVMTQGEHHTDPLKPTPSWLNIPKTQAEAILETYLTSRVEAPARDAKEWLEDLLEFHLLQIASNRDQIEFHHQLFQEYYAAEYLLRLLPNLSNTELKRDYLNYLKWTEAIAFMLGFIEGEDQVLQLVELNLEVDLMLGARLAGEGKLSFQAKTVGKITELEIPAWLKVELLEETKSRSSIPILLDLMRLHLRMLPEIRLHLRKLLEDSKFLYSDLIVKIARALEEFGDEQILPELLATLTDPNFKGLETEVYFSERFVLLLVVISSLGMLASEKAVPALTKEFGKIICCLAGSREFEISKKTSNLTYDFIELAYWLLEAIATALGEIHSEQGISTLLEALKVSNSKVRSVAVYSLEKIGSVQAIPSLLHALKDSEPGVREASVYALGTIGINESILVLQEIVLALLEIVSLDNHSSVREAAVTALEILLQLPSHSRTVGSVVSDAFKKLTPEEVNHLLNALNHSRDDVVESAATLLKYAAIDQNLSFLWKKYLQLELPSLKITIAAVQSRCGYYNYEIAQLAEKEGYREWEVGGVKEEYEKILSILSNMVMVMERNPATFRDIGEEPLRDHFLMQLNGVYEGQATGETFNNKGKTDILLRVGGESIFIAECKFWKGSQILKETFEQLLGYTTWRDAKLAMLIFNRNKNFTAVLQQIPQVIQEHPNFVREVAIDSETQFRFVVNHPDDSDRELLLTVLAFDIPT